MGSAVIAWHTPCYAQGMIEGIFHTQNYEFSKKLLDVSDLRQKAISANIANIETPGYKRVDIDKSFDNRLLESMKSNDMDSFNRLNPIATQDRDAEPMRADGNNVEMERELISLNKNATDYEFLTQYVSTNIKNLNKAIRGSM